MCVPTAARSCCAAFAAAAVLWTLPGCDDGGGGGGAAATPTTTSDTGESPTPASSPTDSPDQTVGGPSKSSQTRSALRAIGAAQRPGGRVFDLEADTTDLGRRVWQAQVAVGQAEFDVVVTADGSRVLSRRRDRTPSDDIAKMRSARVPLGRVIEVAARRAQGRGALTSLEIDTTDAGTVVWQIDFGNDPDTRVTVNARTGRVLEVEV